MDRLYLLIVLLGLVSTVYGRNVQIGNSLGLGTALGGFNGLLPNVVGGRSNSSGSGNTTLSAGLSLGFSVRASGSQNQTGGSSPENLAAQIISNLLLNVERQRNRTVANVTSGLQALTNLLGGATSDILSQADHIEGLLAQLQNQLGSAVSGSASGSAAANSSIGTGGIGNIIGGSTGSTNGGGLLGSFIRRPASG